MIQGRDLIKVILAVGAIITLVVIAMRFADSGGVASVYGESPKLVISGVNSAGAVPALENYPSAASPTKKSGYTGTLDTKYRSRQPVDCLAGSQLSFSFPDGEPDRLRAYFTYFARSGDTAMYSEEYEALVYDGSLTLPDEGKDFTVYPTDIYSSYLPADFDSSSLTRIYSTVVYFRLVASWDEDMFEYAFAVNLENASPAAGADNLSKVAPAIEIAGTNAKDQTVYPEYYVTKLRSKASRSNYSDFLKSKYDLTRPVDCLQASELSVSFPDGEPDELACNYMTYNYTVPVDDTASEDSAYYPDFYDYLYYTSSNYSFVGEVKSAVEDNRITLPEYPSVAYVNNKDTGSSAYVKTSKVFYRLTATWGEESYEYIFAVNLTDSNAPDTTDLYIPGGFPVLHVNGVNSNGDITEVPTLSVVPASNMSIMGYMGLLTGHGQSSFLPPTDVSDCSKLTLSFDSAQPDKIVVYSNSSTDFGWSTEKIDRDNFDYDKFVASIYLSSSINLDQLVDADDLVIPLPEFPAPEFMYSEKNNTMISLNQPTVYYKVLAVWGRYAYEYLFCVNLSQ